MNDKIDITFVVPAFKPKMKEESIGTLILAKKLILNGYAVSITRYWDVEPSPYDDYDSFIVAVKNIIFVLIWLHASKYYLHQQKLYSEVPKQNLLQKKLFVYLILLIMSVVVREKTQ